MIRRRVAAGCESGRVSSGSHRLCRCAIFMAVDGGAAAQAGCTGRALHAGDPAVADAVLQPP